MQQLQDTSIMKYQRRFSDALSNISDARSDVSDVRSDDSEVEDRGIH